MWLVPVNTKHQLKNDVEEGVMVDEGREELSRSAGALVDLQPSLGPAG